MGRFEIWEFVPGLEIDGVWRPETLSGIILKIASSHSKKHQTWVQMIPNGFFDTFWPRIDFSCGLDVEMRPKLTPGAGTQVQYSTAFRLHGHAYTLAVAVPSFQPPCSQEIFAHFSLFPGCAVPAAEERH